MQITKLKSINIALLSFFLMVQLFTFFPLAPATAASLWDNQVGMKSTEVGAAFNGGTTPKDIRVTIGQIIKVFLSFLGIIFLVLMIWAGFRWMTSGGNEQTVTEAKSQIINAVIGLTIILISYSITFYITSCIFEAATSSSMFCK